MLSKVKWAVGNEMNPAATTASFMVSTISALLVSLPLAAVEVVENALLAPGGYGDRESHKLFVLAVYRARFIHFVVQAAETREETVRLLHGLVYP